MEYLIPWLIVLNIGWFVICWGCFRKLEKLNQFLTHSNERLIDMLRKFEGK